MEKIPARTQSSVAVSGDGERWFLVNASPDLRAQIESFPGLQPQPGDGAATRSSPIEGVLLTNADLDHVLGIFLLRESSAPLRLHAAAAVRESLCEAMRLDALLGVFCGVEWQEPSREFAPLRLRDGAESGVRFRAIPLAVAPPLFAKDLDMPTCSVHSVAYEIADAKTGASVLIAPDVAAFNDELCRVLCESDAVLFDGTFWSNAELRAVNPNARTAEEMGHIPICGGSLDVLRELSAARKIYMHINNTNPILAPGSRERAEVERAGIVVADDGMEFEL